MPNSFASLGVPDDLVSVLDQQGITEPFPIQEVAIPDALAGKDICGQAPTGSGKTIAFALALVAQLSERRGEPRSPEALVLVPTRELCNQVTRELVPLARARGRKVVAVYGGVSDRPQRQALSKPGTIAVACPGRLEDLVNQRALRLDKVRHVVIDEADQMSDMGFLPAVQRILDMTDPKRQTQLFSATLGGPVASLVRNYQSEPVRHETGSALPTIRIEDHKFHAVNRAERATETAKLIADHGSAIVFCRTRHGATRLAKQLNNLGVSAAELHGGRSQAQRDRALKAFANERVRALVATDVAARGIHIDDVACVIHFDLPADSDTYIHRSGRTGRAGADGTVITLVDDTNKGAANRLRKSLSTDSPSQRPPYERLNGSTNKAPTSSSQTKKKDLKHDTTRSVGRSDTASDPSRGRHHRGKQQQGPGASRKRSTRGAKHLETGQITTIHTHRGFGFIGREGANDIFVHHTNVSDGSWRKLTVGDRVRFRIGPGPKGSQALDVSVI